MTDTHTLLSEYATNGSDSAFRELVNRYFALVYSSALRLVGGDAQLAEDVSQTVFLNLARKARGLPPSVMLGGWLHRDACFAARALMRRERRRQQRERQTMEMSTIEDHSAANLAKLAPLLDEAIEALREEDRMAILLRYFEQLDFRSIGLALGHSEEAARKRVERAVEKLHGSLTGRGVTLSVAALGTVLAADTITATPSGLAASVAHAALAGASVGSALSATLLKVASLTKVQSSLLGAAILIGAAATLVIQHRAQAATRVLDQTIGQQSAELARMQSENERLAALVRDDSPTVNSRTALVNLRREVESLRQQAASLAVSPAQKTNITFPLLERREEDRKGAIARLNYTRRWLLAFQAFAKENDDQFPTRFDQALPFLPEAGPVQTNLSPDQFEIVYRGPATNIVSPDFVVVLREKQPSRGYDGSWSRVYGFADGHSEIPGKADDEERAWEERKIIGPPVGQ